MGRNIEIKVRARDFERQKALAAAVSGKPRILRQEDTFFRCRTGRLKLRSFADGTGELIHYERPDATGLAESQYVISPTADPERLKEALGRALGVRAVVRKTRRVYTVGETRIHLDEVEGLGQFIELEVVLSPGQTTEEAVKTANRLMEKLEIRDADLVGSAYVDLLDEGA